MCPGANEGDSDSGIKKYSKQEKKENSDIWFPWAKKNEWKHGNI